MQNFGRNILVPFMATALGLGIVQSQAHAAATPAEKAMTFLSKSMAVDSKCKFLSEVDHDDLSSLVARAELSLANRASVEIAKSALSQGRILGSASACNDAARAEVDAVISAAKTAAAQAPALKPMEPETALAAPTQVVLSARAVKTKPTAKLKPALASVKQPVAAKTPKLASYANITQKYYFVRRCGGLSSAHINSLYQNVVAMHRESLKTFGTGQVANAMQQAEAQAGAKSCG